MSTSNIQNYLSNVFRPTYKFNSDTGQFEAALNMSNINTLTVNSLGASQFNIGDINGNVYVGSNAGNSSDTLRDAFRNVAVGATAGFSISNVKDSVFLGYASGLNTADASSIIAIGKGTVTGGSKTIYVGTDTGNVFGSNNIFIGHGISPSGTVNDRIYIGKDSSGQTVFNADLSQNRVGIFTDTPLYPIDLHKYTYVQDGLGINADPRQHTLNVNGDFSVEDGYGFMFFDHDEVTKDSIFTFGSYTAGKKAIMTVSGDLTVTGNINLSGSSFTTEVGALKLIASNVLDASSAVALMNIVNVSGLMTTTSGVVMTYLNVSALTVGGGTMDASQTNVIFNNIGARGNLNVSGVSSFYNTLNVSGAINASGAVFLSSNLGVAGGMNVSGISTVYNTLNIFSNGLNVSGVSLFNSNVGIKGTLNTSGISLFTSNVGVGGTLDVSGVSSFTSNVGVVGTLNVSGVTTLSNLTVTGTITNAGTPVFTNLSLAGTLGVQGNTSLSNTFVSGILTMSGGSAAINASSSTADVNVLLARNALSAGGTTSLNILTVSGAATFSNAGTFATLESLGLFTVGGTSLLCNVGARGTLNVSGASQFASTITASSILINNSAAVRGGLNVSGPVSFFNTLGVLGGINASATTTLSNLTVTGTLSNVGSNVFNSLASTGTLNVSGPVSFFNTLGVLGGINASGTTTLSNLNVTGTLNTLGTGSFANLATPGTLNVSGISTFYNTLNVFSNGLNVSGTSTFNSNVGVVGALNVCGVTTLTNLTVNGVLSNTAGTNVFSNLAATGTLNVSGVASLFSNAGIRGTLNVSGVTTLTSNLGVVGALNVCSGLVSTSFMETKSDLYVRGASYLTFIQSDRTAPTIPTFNQHFALTNVSGTAPYWLWTLDTFNGPLGTRSNGDFGITARQIDNVATGVTSRTFVPLTLQRSTGYVGISNTNPSYQLDVGGVIRGSSNIVAMQTSAMAISDTWISWSTGSLTYVTSNILSFTYTPKQSGNVTVIVEGRIEQSLTGGGGFDNYGYRVLNTTASAELGYFNTCWASANLGNSGRGLNVENFANTRAVTTINGPTAFLLQIYMSCDDVTYYRRGNLTVTELSSI